MPEPAYLVGAVLCAAALTFLLRLIPFTVKNQLKDSALLADLARWIPLGAMLLLAAYILFHIDYSSQATALPYLAGAAVTVLVHLWRKNMFLSMICGTVVCVFLANWVF